MPGYRTGLAMAVHLDLPAFIQLKQLLTGAG